jgi:hypothetical protein
MADFQARRVICPDPATAGSIGEDLRLCRLWWLQGQKCLLLAQAQFTLNLMSALFSARLFRWSHFFTSLSVVACRPCLPLILSANGTLSTLLPHFHIQLSRLTY